jgi:hypothetical protein
MDWLDLVNRLMADHPNAWPVPTRRRITEPSGLTWNQYGNLYYGYRYLGAVTRGRRSDSGWSMWLRGECKGSMPTEAEARELLERYARHLVKREKIDETSL